MVKDKLTENEVNRTSCPSSSKNIDLLDGNGLELRISRKGSKIWRYRYKIHGAKKTLTLGAYPEISLKQARRMRDKASILIKAGLEPSSQQPVIPELRLKPQTKRSRLIPFAPQQGITFNVVIDEYIETLNNRSSQKEVKRAVYKELIPAWGKRNPESITLREAVLMLDMIAKRAPVLSDRLYAYLKRAYTVSIQRGLITVNPLANLQKPAPEAEIRNNAEKVLSHEQLRILIQFTKQSEATMMDDALMMILWTGARPSEVLNMQWKQIDGDQWTLGPKEHKGGHKRARSITRPLNDAAMRILKKYEGLNTQYVFPGRFEKPSSHIRLSRHVRDIRKCYGIKEFTPNHLRHTISTRMREIGIRPDIVERIIGHHVDSGIVGVYSSYNWVPEMKEALIKWENWIIEN